MKIIKNFLLFVLLFFISTNPLFAIGQKCKVGTAIKDGDKIIGYAFYCKGDKDKNGNEILSKKEFSNNFGPNKVGLMSAPKDLELEELISNNGITWWNGNYIKIEAGASVGRGLSNTSNIINKQGKGNYAASLCGSSGWFLPSKDELILMYQSRNSIGNFASNSWYWSSSEFSDPKHPDISSEENAWVQGFDINTMDPLFDRKSYPCWSSNNCDVIGFQGYNPKNANDGRVRCAKAF